MTTEQTLEKGRKAFQQQQWGDAYHHLSKADEASVLRAGDLETLAMAAYLTGKPGVYETVWTRAHNAYQNDSDMTGAVRCAFWLGFILLNSGEMARGGGWIAHAGSLLQGAAGEYVEQGYLLLPEALRSLGSGNAERALEKFEEAGQIAGKFQDTDLLTISRLGRGQALVRLGEIQKGASLLDEAMVAVEAGKVAPIVAGIVYCAVIETCLEIYDLSRAREWTDALSNWCASQPQLVPYRGQCLIRRSEIMQLHGNWSNATDEAARAITFLTKPKGEPAAGAAFYQLGELYRLHGESIKAEEAYRQASQWGKKPQPGFALLRLMQGKVEEAEKSIESALNETGNLKMRSRILPAFVEIKLVAGNVEEARHAANNLTDIAHKLDADLMYATATQADGAVLLAEGQALKALAQLRKAWEFWEQLEAPYEGARTRVLIGEAYSQTGDNDSAEMEYEAARSVFTDLGAKPELASVDKRLRNQKAQPTHNLSNRELEVLRLIAKGNTNKAIASELYISERTVERHVSNIFTKLNVTSRSAATAYAFQQQLV